MAEELKVSVQVSTLFELNEPIGLWELPLSPQDYEVACYRALAGDDVLVFVDTNVLSAAFRLHQEAREGLFKLLRIPLASKRLIVPAWVANEYVHNAFKASKTHGFREADLERLRASIPATKTLSAVLHQVASDRDMEKIAKRLKVTPAQASQALNERVEQITHALRDAGSDLAIDAVHGELLTELRAAFIPNDLGQIARLVADQAEYRKSSRIPPGLTDTEKGEAADGGEVAGNADGDLAVWLEILQLVSERVTSQGNASEVRSAKSVLFITQEKKEDFLYRPRRRIADAAKGLATEDNKDIRLIDPRLVSEFEYRVGHRRVAIANLETIAAGALAVIEDREFQDSVGLFIAAMRKQKRVAESKQDAVPATFGDAIDEKTLEIQRNESSQIDSNIEATVSTSDEQPVAEAAEPEHTPAVLPELLPISAAAMVERARLGAIPEVSQFIQIIANLLSENKRTEDIAVQRLQFIGLPEHPDASFALGRAMFAAMQHGATKATALFSTVSAGSLIVTARDQAFLAGGLFEAFFEAKGRLRETVLREGLPLLLDRVSQGGWHLARHFIHTELTPFANRFFWIPGGEQHTLRLRVDFADINDALVVKGVFTQYPGKPDLQLLKEKQSTLQSSYMGNTINLATLDAAMTRLSLLPDDRVHIELNGPEIGRRALTIPESMFVNTELVNVPLDE